MERGQLRWIANFICDIADDDLRAPHVLCEYREVIRPTTVPRRLIPGMPQAFCLDNCR